MNNIRKQIEEDKHRRKVESLLKDVNENLAAIGSLIFVGVFLLAAITVHLYFGFKFVE